MFESFRKLRLRNRIRALEDTFDEHARQLRRLEDGIADLREVTQRWMMRSIKRAERSLEAAPATPGADSGGDGLTDPISARIHARRSRTPPPKLPTEE